MKIAIISFTSEGRGIARKLAGLLRGEGHAVNEDVKSAAFDRIRL